MWRRTGTGRRIPGGEFEILDGIITEKPRNVLDLGAGKGALARPLAERVDRVDAVDVSAAMIEAGRRRPGGDRANLRWILVTWSSPVRPRPRPSSSGQRSRPMWSISTSRASLAREHMAPGEVAEFGRSVERAVGQWAADGVLTMRVVATITWGAPSRRGEYVLGVYAQCMLPP